ncbi:MAG: hypothetical protein SGJ01_08140 [Gemmatimonadota bacterium]|nr:hypothetical protein [Gemmatimonadota bacterium]
MRRSWFFTLLALPLVVPSPRVQEYEIPLAGSFPHDPAVDRSGIVWYTDQANSTIGRLDPESGEIIDFPTPTEGSGPHGLDVADDGSIWYTAQRIGALGRLDPASGVITEFPLPATGRNPHTPLVHQ